MAVSKEFVEHVLDLLSGLGPVTARPMFGGYDLYLEGRVFALLHHDTLYLKADEISRPDFEAAGLPQFRPHVKGKPFPMPYFEAPEDALEDADELCRWARRALEAAQRAPAKPERHRRRAPASEGGAKGGGRT